jgi:hypothetical protein
MARSHGDPRSDLSFAELTNFGAGAPSSLKKRAYEVLLGRDNRVIPHCRTFFFANSLVATPINEDTESPDGRRHNSRKNLLANALQPLEISRI